jgi:hypothetical protein
VVPRVEVADVRCGLGGQADERGTFLLLPSTHTVAEVPMGAISDASRPVQCGKLRDPGDPDGSLPAAYGLRPQPFYLGIGFAVAGLILSILLVRETQSHAHLEFWRDLGYAIGAVVAGWTADALGLKVGIGVIAAITFVSGLVVSLRMRETALRTTSVTSLPARD